MEKIVICGIGNRMRGDDAAGPLVIDALKKASSMENVMLLDCGEAPESFLGKVESFRPNTIVIVDAVEMKKPAGTVEEIDVTRIKGRMMSTHNIPMTLFLEYLQTRLAGVEMYFIGIQPKSIALNAKVCPECKRAVSKAKRMLLKLINPEK